MNIEELTDTELHAYVDNELDARQMERISVAAHADPALKEKIAAIRTLKADIAKSFTHIQTDTSPASLLNTLTEKPKSGFQHWAAAACLVVGVAGGYLWGQYNSTSRVTIEQDWIAQVVNYQDMYTTDTLEHVESSSGDREATIERLTNALQHNVVIPQFSDKSVEFKRGQILTSHQNPVIQLAFLDSSTGTPIALCMTPSNKSDREFSNGNVYGMNYINWSNGELEFLLVGNFSHEQLQMLAQDARTQFVGGA